jgi:hypothetical protein
MWDDVARREGDSTVQVYISMGEPGGTGVCCVNEGVPGESME